MRIGVNLTKIMGASEHLELGYNAAHSQRPCWGGYGRGLSWVRSKTLSRLSIEWGMKNVGTKKQNFLKYVKGNKI